MRRPSPAAIVLALFALAMWWIAKPKPVPTPAVAPAKPATVAPAAPSATAPVPVSAAGPSAAPAPISAAIPAERSALLDALNAPAGTIQADLRLVHEVFATWRTNFPREGNPVGENAEITRALAGANPLNLALVPKNHPALNAAGELTDRWGTPFRFHQLAGDRMEIRSAGPDRRFGNEDDAVFAP